MVCIMLALWVCLPVAAGARADRPVGSSGPIDLDTTAETVGGAPEALADDWNQDAAPSPLQSPLTDDPRSTILLRYGCRSDAGRQEVTLFEDGTVRLREVAAPGADEETEGVSTEQAGTGEETMELYELDPDSLSAYQARLADEDLSEVEVERDPVDGAWVETCALDLLRFPPPGESSPPVPLHYRFSRYSPLPLALSRVVRIAEDLIAEVDKAPKNRLPEDYEPRPGDILERSDGVLFEVVDFTVDKKGVELTGVEAPLVLYLPPTALRERFVRVVSRGDKTGPGGGSR